MVCMLLVCIGLLPKAQAVSPPPDGGYPNFTTAEGQNALFSLTTGVANTAIGWSSLKSSTTGSFNTGVGAGTLALNTADSNTATGAAALLLNTSGTENTAHGTAALVSNSTGNFNSAFGAFALNNNVEGDYNTATGLNSLYSNTIGSENTAICNVALASNATGSGNTAVGASALLHTLTGQNNTALGRLAGFAVKTANNVISIGADVYGANISNSCFIGQIYSNVQPIVGTDPDSVTIASSGRLGRGNVSSRRYKHDINPMEKASEALYSLKPVSFRYNKEYDATQTLAFGLIAEEVAEVYPELVGRNPNGEPESVRYDQINAMLLNEFLKQHRKVQELEATFAKQQKDFQATATCQQKQIEALTEGLQKVSAQIEVSKFGPRQIRRGGATPNVVLNNQ